MGQALAIHIDDVESTANKCLLLLKRLQHTYGGTDHWKRMLKKIVRQAKDLQIKENNLLKIPYENLSVSAKSKIAYNLKEKGGVNNNKRAAEIHLDLMTLTKQTPNNAYHTGRYIISLYGSNQAEMANAVFADFASWAEIHPTQSYAFLVSTCFQEKILYYKEDAKQVQIIWEEAMKHPAVSKENVFRLQMLCKMN